MLFSVNHIGVPVMHRITGEVSLNHLMPVVSGDFSKVIFPFVIYILEKILLEYADFLFLLKLSPVF